MLEDNDGVTALMLASDMGEHEVVKVLIDKGADVNAEDSRGYTALMAASDTGQIKAVEVLVE